MADEASAAGLGRCPLAAKVTEKSVRQRCWGQVLLADEKSGLHFCFQALTPANVDAFHAEAVAAGGRDSGKPGIRPDYGSDYNAAFVIDPAGYRVEAYCPRS